MGPLALLALFLPSPVDVVKRSVRPNAYSSSMPSQAAAAQDQTLRGALRGGFSGLTGSEQDYADEQASGDSSRGAPLATTNDGLTKRVPQFTSWYAANLPAGLIEGRGTGPQTGAYNKGWINLLPGDGRSWGATTRDSAPHVIPTTLLYATDRAPLPRAVADAYAAQHRGRTRLTDHFGD